MESIIGAKNSPWSFSHGSVIFQVSKILKLSLTESLAQVCLFASENLNSDRNSQFTLFLELIENITANLCLSFGPRPLKQNH